MHGKVKFTNPEGENGVGYQHQPQNNFGRPRSHWAHSKQTDAPEISFFS